jgi:hypothetical protein
MQPPKRSYCLDKSSTPTTGMKQNHGGSKREYDWGTLRSGGIFTQRRGERGGHRSHGMHVRAVRKDEPLIYFPVLFRCQIEGVRIEANLAPAGESPTIRPRMAYASKSRAHTDAAGANNKRRTLRRRRPSLDRLLRRPALRREERRQEGRRRHRVSPEPAGGGYLTSEDLRCEDAARRWETLIWAAGGVRRSAARRVGTGRGGSRRRRRVSPGRQEGENRGPARTSTGRRGGAGTEIPASPGGLRRRQCVARNWKPPRALNRSFLYARRGQLLSSSMHHTISTCSFIIFSIFIY